MLAPFERQDGESPYEVHADLQEIMQNLVGIFRTEQRPRSRSAEARTTEGARCNAEHKARACSIPAGTYVRT